VITISFKFWDFLLCLSMRETNLARAALGCRPAPVNGNDGTVNKL